MRRKLESLSKKQRRGTPLPFALYLFDRVLAMAPSAKRVAVLWCCQGTVYRELWPAVQLWGVRRNAWRYPGPYPVICHPPCGPWGQYARKSHESRLDGLLALEMVHRWGGVVEQPRGSQLFKQFGMGGHVETVDQASYGHLALKPTLLYFVNPP